MIKLYKKYPEENLEMLFPLFILYYKQGDDKKAKEYLDRINKANPDFIKFFKGTMKENTKVPDGYYSKGDSSEVIMYFRQYDFLVGTIPTIDYYILENIKKKKDSCGKILPQESAVLQLLFLFFFLRVLFFQGFCLLRIFFG